MSLESPDHVLSLNLKGHLVFPLGVLTLETISLLEKIQFSMFLESPDHDLSQLLEDHFLSLFNYCFPRRGFNFGRTIPLLEKLHF